MRKRETEKKWAAHLRAKATFICPTVRFTAFAWVAAGRILDWLKTWVLI